MKFDNLASNIGNELIKKVYAVAYNLCATRIVVTKAKYNKYAVVTLYEEPHGCICEDYVISL